MLVNFEDKDMKPNVVFFSLASGEGIIGHLTGIDEEYGTRSFVIHKPVVPHVIPTNPNRTNFSVSVLPLRPFLGNVDEIKVATDHVAYMHPVSPEMASLYQQFTSDITLAATLPPQLLTESR